MPPKLKPQPGQSLPSRKPQTLAKHLKTDTQLCARLKARGIPYVSYSGYEPVEGASENSVFISKPVSMDVLMNALESLLVGRPRRVS
jgi:hypothetical protein